MGVGEGVSVGVSVASVHLHVCVGFGVGKAVREAVGVTVAVREAVGVCGGVTVGIKNGVGGTIFVGTSQDANAFGEHPLIANAPAPRPAIFKKSLRETMVVTASGNRLRLVVNYRVRAPRAS